MPLPCLDCSREHLGEVTLAERSELGRVIAHVVEHGTSFVDNLTKTGHHNALDRCLVRHVQLHATPAVLAVLVYCSICPTVKS